MSAGPAGLVVGAGNRPAQAGWPGEEPVFAPRAGHGTAPGVVLAWSLRAPVATQLVLLVVAAWNNVHLQNTDAVAYLRIASYYAAGKTDLMVSGYWGPLLSWLAAPLLAVGVAPLVAARVVMAASAVIFLAGAIGLFRAHGLSRGGQVAGAWGVAIATVFWSVQYITPDLLVAGLTCLALSAVVRAQWAEQRPVQVTGGLAWALAYFAKATALPVAVLASGGLAIVHWAAGHASPRRVGAALGWTLVGLAAVAAPWVLVLSLTYGAPTLTTSARINHAIVGPGDVARWHSFARVLQPPAPGRVTSWEDPSRLPYRSWSPLESRMYAIHQLGLVRGNAGTVLRILSQFDWLRLGLVACLACLVLRRPWRERLAGERWRWAVVPLAALSVVYLPGYVRAADDRYLYAALPLLFVAALGAAEWLGGAAGRWRGPARRIAVALVVLSFVLPGLIRLPSALVGLPQPASVAAEELAHRMRAAGIRGPIAGNGIVAGGRAGLYTAFLLGEPWYGDEPGATPERYAGSGARLIIVVRDQPVVAALDGSPDFRSLDEHLFSSQAEAGAFPLKVYRAREGR